MSRFFSQVSLLLIACIVYSTIVDIECFPNIQKPIVNINHSEKSNVIKSSSVYLATGLGYLNPFNHNSNHGSIANANTGLNMNNNNDGNNAIIKKASTYTTCKPGATNEVVKVINNIRHKRLGHGDIEVSEIGLGTQRWVSEDFNAPNEELCFKFLDEAVLNQGINLIDTAEQYPIPSSPSKPEGLTESIIGKWIGLSTGSASSIQSKTKREKLIITTKITGGSNINKKNLHQDCENSLKRLNTDYIDVYLLHWPARYTPQSNWGQSLQYHYTAEPYYQNNAGFVEIAETMGQLVKEGKIRGWGMCNDNAFGLTASCAAAKHLGVPVPVAMQNDFSMIDRRAEENGVSEASSPIHENVGFMAYNALAGGYLTGKYLVPGTPPPTYDNPSFAASQLTRLAPRGRHDEAGWSRTLYRYRSGPATTAIQLYAKLADKYKITLAEMALRWCRERQAVTSTLVGHTSMAQLKDSIKFFQNSEKLPAELMWEIDRIHMMNRLPIFSSTRVGADWYGEGEIGERIP